MADRQIEKMLRQLQQYMDAHDTGEDMTEEKLKALADRFFQEQDEKGAPEEVTPQTAKTSEDFLELAQNSRDNASLCRKYAEKAIALDPDNLDAQCLLTDLNFPRGQNPEKRLARDEEVVEQGRDYMKRLEVPDGNYWGDVRTRPFMRALDQYAMDCYYYGMHRKCASLFEEMIRCNPGDNQGIRSVLILLYMFLEEEEKAEKLYAAYSDNGEETVLLLGMADLKFRLGKLREAENYLQKLLNTNPGTKKFFRTVEDDEEELMPYQKLTYLRPFTYEELAASYAQAFDLFDSCFSFFLWGNRVLSGMRAKKRGK